MNMNRKILYAKIKEYNLQEAVERAFAENYTRVSNSGLACIISKYESKTKTSPEVTNKTVDEKKCKCDKLIEVLKKKHILLDSEVNYINS